MYDHWQFDKPNNRYTGRLVYEKLNRIPGGFYCIGEDANGAPVVAPLFLRPESICEFSTGPYRQVLDEIADFWENADRYRLLGVSHKRSILLYGPPGCGKSIILQSAIADVISRNGIAVRPEGNFNVLTRQLFKIRQIQPDTSFLILLEDLDTYVKNYQHFILELLDGTTSGHGGILFLSTTNFLGDIPTRIRCRPSRVDTLIEVGFPDEIDRLRYINFVLEGMKGKPLDRDQIDTIVDGTSGLAFADVKEVVLSVAVYGRTPEDSIDRIKESKDILAEKEEV